MFRWQNLRPLGICWINDDVIGRLRTNHNPCLSIDICSFIPSKSRGQISTPTQPFKSWLCSWARRFKTFEERYFQISALRKKGWNYFSELRIQLVVNFSGILISGLQWIRNSTVMSEFTLFWLSFWHLCRQPFLSRCHIFFEWFKNSLKLTLEITSKRQPYFL